VDINSTVPNLAVMGISIAMIVSEGQEIVDAYSSYFAISYGAVPVVNLAAV